ncbi:MAG TPA: UDP-glucose 4-epimerase GalE [Spirochaetia bacterium]|nr:UDP-glucose 4-epimerase GalE [Spirochaetia bacterium]
MRILVVGGAGYIGSHVARAFLDRGDGVTVYDNLSSGREENLFSHAEFIRGDILDGEKLKSVLAEGFDGLIHLAAFKAAGESMIKPEKYSVNNISGSLSILNACAATGINAIVFSSSAAVYGEPRYCPVDEKHPTEPINYYGYTKLQIEGFLRWYEKLKNIRYAALRYFNAAGYDPDGRILGLEQNPENLLPVIMEAAVGKRKSLKIFGDDYDTRDGTGIRDYVHVTDLADAHVRALDWIRAQNKSLTCNLGSDHGISVKEMLSTAREVSGREIPAESAPRRPGDPAVLYASSEKAAEALGWRARLSDVNTIVETTWRVYRRNLDEKV